MDAMLWWIIPIMATLGAMAWVRFSSRERGPVEPEDSMAAHQKFSAAMERANRYSSGNR